MRIVVHGQQAFGRAVLEALLDRGEEVVAVYAAPDRPSGPPDPLKQAARERELPVFQPDSYKKPEVAEAFRALAPDLCVMAFVTLIVPRSFLDIPSRGSIQYHPSLLPRHRGPSSINWPIIQGESRTGLTIFWPDDGLDTGPILLQKEVEIGPDDTLGSVYFDKLFPQGVAAMVEAVDLVERGCAPRIEQDESEASYESWCRAATAEIDWRRPVGAIHDLIRGTDPRPGAWTTLAGEKLQLYGARRIEAPSGAAPGEIVELGDDGVVIAAPGGAIRADRLRAAGGEKRTAAAFAAERGLAPGLRLG